MRVSTYFQVFLAALLSVATAVDYTPIQPPSYPLAVRNPYLSAWIPGGLVANMSTTRAQFWTGAQLTWSVIARVDGVTYNVFGVKTPESHTQSSTLISAEYTSTKTIFVHNAGNAQIQLEFLSPVNPKDYVRQSLPFSYLTVRVLGVLNGKPANVQIYSDVDDSWNGQNMELFDQKSAWNLTRSGYANTWEITNTGAVEYAEGGPNNDMATWGSTIYSTQPAWGSQLSTAAGPLSAIRSHFVSNGGLSSMGDNPDWTAGSVTAFAHDLGKVSSAEGVTFAIGYYRDCVVEYLGDCRVGYFRSKYNDPVSAALFFLNDYGAASNQSNEMDSDISGRAIKAAGQKYADIITLSARQTYGGLDLTVPTGTLDVDDHMIFLKEISSDGNLNTMDVIFPAFPQFFVQDPEYIRLLLEPVVQYLASGRWTKPFVIHDMGSHYPIADGHDGGVEEDQPIEETGNLLILAYIYQNATGNTAWAAKYESLFQGYADYLFENGLYPSVQLSTDDAAGPAGNQTNLAIKAAVGLTSFGAITGKTEYTTKGLGFATQIYDDGLGTDAKKTHFTLEYGNDTTWTTTFNLYPDYLLKLNTFNSSAYDMQSTWYPTVRATAGVALDSVLDWAKTDWQIYAGAMGNTQTLSMFVDDLHTYLSNGLNDAPFSDRYFVKSPDTPGAYSQYRNRPVVGGEWAAMALLGQL